MTQLFFSQHVRTAPGGWSCTLHIGLAHWCRAMPDTNVQDHSPGRDTTIIQPVTWATSLYKRDNYGQHVYWVMGYIQYHWSLLIVECICARLLILQCRLFSVGRGVACVQTPALFRDANFCNFIVLCGMQSRLWCQNDKINRILSVASQLARA